MPTLEETQKAIDLLEVHKNIITESYLSPFNGTSSQCSGGVPESAVTRRCLEVGGFEPTEKGFEEAIRAGWALINAERGGVNILLSGEEGVNYWRERNTLGTVSFRVNPGESRYILATAKRRDASFVVDAISTDGGGIPRNATVELGLGLVHWGGMTLAEFVQKACVNPAAILGLSTKGHLAPGADADVTVVDLECCKPYLAIANGKLIMYRGAVIGRSAIIITTGKGQAAVKSLGLQPYIVDLEQSGFYKMRVDGC